MGSWIHPDVGRKKHQYYPTVHSYTPILLLIWNVESVEVLRTTCLSTLSITICLNHFLSQIVYSFSLSPLTVSVISPHLFLFAALHVTAKTMSLRMRKASQQPNPPLSVRPSRTKRRHSEVEEDTPTSGGRGLFSTIKKLIRGNAVKVTTTMISSVDLSNSRKLCYL